MKMNYPNLIKNVTIKIKNVPQNRGITLVEIVVTVAIITIFALIVIAGFPTIEKQSALSGSAYKLEQDIRKAEDLGLSGVIIKDSLGNKVAASGYGVYVVANQTKYLIYADVKPDSAHPGNGAYDGDFATPLCGSQPNWKTDCVIQIIDISRQNSSLSIGSIGSGIANSSINFVPPGPSTTISNIVLGNSIDIAILNGISSRVVSVNTSGLIYLK